MADDLADVIARLRASWQRTKTGDFTVIDIADFTRLLDAAEAGMRAMNDVGFALSTPDVDAARDAALEEAAKEAERYTPAVVTTHYAHGYIDAVLQITSAIRALRRPA